MEILELRLGSQGGWREMLTHSCILAVPPVTAPITDGSANQCCAFGRSELIPVELSLHNCKNPIEKCWFRQACPWKLPWAFSLAWERWDINKLLFPHEGGPFCCYPLSPIGSIGLYKGMNSGDHSNGNVGPTQFTGLVQGLLLFVASSMWNSLHW